jgi:hypothetical protein
MCGFCKIPFRNQRIGNRRRGKTSAFQQLEADLIPIKTHRITRVSPAATALGGMVVLMRLRVPPGNTSYI